MDNAVTIPCCDTNCNDSSIRTYLTAPGSTGQCPFCHSKLLPDDLRPNHDLRAELKKFKYNASTPNFNLDEYLKADHDRNLITLRTDKAKAKAKAKEEAGPPEAKGVDPMYAFDEEDEYSDEEGGASIPRIDDEEPKVSGSMTHRY